MHFFLIDFFAENEKEEKFRLFVFLASTFPAQPRQWDYYSTPKTIIQMLASCLIVSCYGIFYLNDLVEVKFYGEEDMANEVSLLSCFEASLAEKPPRSFDM